MPVVVEGDGLQRGLVGGGEELGEHHRSVIAGEDVAIGEGAHVELLPPRREVHVHASARLEKRVELLEEGGIVGEVLHDPTEHDGVVPLARRIGEDALVGHAQPGGQGVDGAPLGEVGELLAGDGQHGHVRPARGGVPEAVALLEEATAQSAALRLMPTHAWNVTMLAESYLLAGRGDDAAREVERGLGMARANKQRWLEAEGYQIKSEVRSQADATDLAGALADGERAVSIAGEMGLRPLLGRCHLALAPVGRRAGDGGRGSTSSGRPPCSARWTCASGWSRRRPRDGLSEAPPRPESATRRLWDNRL